MDRVDVIEMAKKAGYRDEPTYGVCSADNSYTDFNMQMFAALIKEAVIAELIKDGWRKENINGAA